MDGTIRRPLSLVGIEYTAVVDHEDEHRRYAIEHEHTVW
jgi:hypothetical protein